MSNALALEKSPYLRQHADNPVDWWPWGEAAFARARKEQKPIFLSIGYSTCHWCHVMAHESFANEEIAALLNAHFVAIKVDREERPDVDRVYMTYVQSMAGHGGWPLSAWLTPDLKPFYGGTYFPPEDRPGRAGFPAILRAIARGWEQERDRLVAEGERAINILRRHAAEGPGPGTPATEIVDGDLAQVGGDACQRCFHHFHETFDEVNGGFGGAPKFPRAAGLSFLFHCAALQGGDSKSGPTAIGMATGTLRKMAQGGLHDHVGGGFHRYSVDAQWFVPHFEKMLYDQAQIALNCLDAHRATGDERYAWLARGIFAYVARDLTSPAGAFYAAEDADSAPAGAPPGMHSEGAFYVWTKAEIEAALAAESALFCTHFGVAENGNVPAQSDPFGELTGKNILSQRQSLEATAHTHGLAPEEANDRLVAALEKLRQVRDRRPRPHLDDKIITAWNGLMISALARGQVLGLPGGGTLPAAIQAAAFIQRELYDAARGVLYRSYREGRSNIEGFAEDYAFLVQGLLDLYEASFEIRWLQWAERLQQTMDERFWDEPRGGYFNSAAGDASILLRLKEDYDGAEPAPSSVAAMNLLRLGAIRGDGAAARNPGPQVSYRRRGQRTLEAFRAQWSAVPQALPQMLCALDLALEPPRHVVLAGDPGTDDFRALAQVLQEGPGPRRTVLCADGAEGQAWLAARAPWLAGMHLIKGHATAYLCENFTCLAPVTTPAELRALLTRT